MVVELDPRLLEILACPAPDHGALRVGAPDDPRADELSCTSCGRRYPVVDGVPVLLLDEARTPESGSAGSGPANGSPDEK